MENSGTNTTNQGSGNNVQWYSDGAISPPYSRTKEGTIILGAGRDGVAVLSVRGTNGSEAVRLDKNGLTVKNSVGTNIVTVTNTGIQVYGTNGSNIVTLDSNGLTVNNGSISIRDGSGSTIIDSTGLVSSNNFVFGTTTTQSTNTTGAGFGTPRDVANTSLNIVASRTVSVLLMVNCLATTLTANNFTIVEMALGGSYLTSIGYVSSVQTGVNAFYIATVGAGTTDFRLRIEGANAIQVGFVNLQTGYMIMGK